MATTGEIYNVTVNLVNDIPPSAEIRSTNWKMRASRVEYAVLTGGVVNLRVYPRTQDNTAAVQQDAAQVDVKKKEVVPPPSPVKTKRPRVMRTTARAQPKSENTRAPNPHMFISEAKPDPRVVPTQDPYNVNRQMPSKPASVTVPQAQVPVEQPNKNIKLTWKCNIANCVKRPRRRVRVDDHWGPAGPRCFRHGANAYVNTESKAKQKIVKPTDIPPSTVPESTMNNIIQQKEEIKEVGPVENVVKPPSRTRRGNVSLDDMNAKKPRRARRSKNPSSEEAIMGNSMTGNIDAVTEGLRTKHGARICNVEGCTTPSKGKMTDVNDTEGLRTKHGARICNVEGCITPSKSKVLEVDNFGPLGPRCKKHGGGERCTVSGCEKASSGRTQESDNHGLPGPRCSNHGGGIRCNLPDCNKLSRGRIPNDEMGPAGYRCYKHGGRHSVENGVVTKFDKHVDIKNSPKNEKPDSNHLITKTTASSVDKFLQNIMLVQ